MRRDDAIRILREHESDIGARGRHPAGVIRPLKTAVAAMIEAVERQQGR